MLFGKPQDKRDVSASATRLFGIDPDHPAIVTGSYIALLLFAVLVHRGAWNGGWREDDAQQLLAVMNNPFWRLLFDHDTWLSFADNAFTPILAGYYRLDMALFGLAPHGFYLHHVTELAITAIFTYHLLCRRIPRHLSMLATIGFLVAMPTFSVMNFLQNRHYLTGLLLLIGSAYSYQLAMRDNRTRTLFVSAGLFFLAMLAKELYAVTLIYFLLTSWRTPLFRKVITLYSIAFVIFAAWRAYILGSLIGGIHTDYAFIDRFTSLAQVHRAIFGNDYVAAIFLAAVAALIMRHRLFGTRHLAGLSALLFVIFLPLLFATFVFTYGGNSGLRLSFFPVWLCAVGLAYIATLLHEAGEKKTASILLLAFIVILATASARRMGEFREYIHEYDIQAKFIQNAGPESALFPSGPIGWHLHQNLALAAGGAPAGIIMFRDDISPGFSSYWEYDAHCRCMVQLSHAQTLEKSAHLGNLGESNENDPISLLVTWQARQGMVNISLEPGGNHVCLLSVPGMHSLTACPVSAFPLSSRISTDKFGLLHAQIGHRRNDGLFVSTPYMSVPVDGTLQWSRGVFLPSSAQTDGTSSVCHIDSTGSREIHLTKNSTLELRGWILGSLNTRPDTIPLAILAGSAGKNYAANLHREQRPDVKNPGGMAIGGHVLDANLRQVTPGIYRLLLGVEDTICDTSITMTIL